MRIRLSRQARYMIESTILALLYTVVPVVFLYALQAFRLTTPPFLIIWLVATLGWTALITYVYVKKISKHGGFTFRE
ncbi:MAG: hypothetical protein RMI43_05120 [Candidatus Caldarchaeum sp.]|nr:hypothetical protein [Candidatus Caldarchaeum sp.]MCX8200542.1 hypothetical protein [Candidatus Caldarchaeum sp.]MDW8063532.1 hypothetical protein [Candidatus Caldarchaeum sp.]MDW8434607.1 hypothetical protein [Candidatus Caldarchaeum sp.]